MRKLALGIAAVVLLMLCVGVFFASKAHNKPYIVSGKVLLAPAQDHFAALIVSEGPAKARSAYISDGQTLSDEQSHVLAHAFGGALYQDLGTSGIAYCGDEFAHGCFHQFLGDAITQLGFQAIPTFFRICETLPNETFGCEHGIGHGILASIGYGQSDLESALNLCTSDDPSAVSGTLRGCPDGVFMEYFLRKMAFVDTNGNYVPRPFTESNKFGPCLDVEGAYRIDCAYELPGWWEVSSAVAARSSVWKLIGTYCAELPSTYSQYCFKGAGFEIAKAESMDSTAVQKDCSLTGVSDQNRLFCYVGAIRWYRLMGADQNKVLQACGEFVLSQRDLALCSEKTSIDNAGLQ